MTSPLLRRAALTNGSLSGMIPIATCGAKRIDGHKFTSLNRKVTCPICMAKIKEQRAAAKARFAALEINR